MATLSPGDDSIDASRNFGRSPLNDADVVKTESLDLTDLMRQICERCPEPGISTSIPLNPHENSPSRKRVRLNHDLSLDVNKEYFSSVSRLTEDRRLSADGLLDIGIAQDVAAAIDDSPLMLMSHMLRSLAEDIALQQRKLMALQNLVERHLQKSRKDKCEGVSQSRSAEAAVITPNVTSSSNITISSLLDTSPSGSPPQLSPPALDRSSPFRNKALNHQGCSTSEPSKDNAAPGLEQNNLPLLRVTSADARYTAQSLGAGLPCGVWYDKVENRYVVQCNETTACGRKRRRYFGVAKFGREGARLRAIQERLGVLQSVKGPTMSGENDAMREVHEDLLVSNARGLEGSGTSALPDEATTSRQSTQLTSQPENRKAENCENSEQPTSVLPHDNITSSDELLQQALQGFQAWPNDENSIQTGSIVSSIMRKLNDDILEMPDGPIDNGQ